MCRGNYLILLPETALFQTPNRAKKGKGEEEKSERTRSRRRLYSLNAIVVVKKRTSYDGIAKYKNNHEGKLGGSRTTS